MKKKELCIIHIGMPKTGSSVSHICQHAKRVENGSKCSKK